jgi:Domain of unknown function (DUF1833)
MPVSTAARQAMFAQETGEAFLILLTIDHPDFTAPIRVVNNTVNVTSGGQEYFAYPFDLTLPDSDHDKDIVAHLSIDNVSREITEAIRDADEPPTVEIAVIRAAAPDAHEISLPTFTLRDVNWDALTISGELVLSDITFEPYPAYVFDPNRFPGLF